MPAPFKPDDPFAPESRKVGGVLHNGVYVKNALASQLLCRSSASPKPGAVALQEMNCNIHWNFAGRFFRIIAIVCAETLILGTLAAGATLSAGAPLATTQPAWWLDGNTAALNGMVTPGSSSTIVWFEWGNEDSYEQRTDPVLLDGSDRVIAIQARIFGLASGIIYHSRIVASNLAGITL